MEDVILETPEQIAAAIFATAEALGLDAVPQPSRRTTSWYVAVQAPGSLRRVLARCADHHGTDARDLEFRVGVSASEVIAQLARVFRLPHPKQTGVTVAVGAVARREAMRLERRRASAAAIEEERQIDALCRDERANDLVSVIEPGWPAKKIMAMANRLFPEVGRREKKVLVHLASGRVNDQDRRKNA